MDLLAVLVDAVSILSLILVGIVGWRTIQAFHQSKQAVTESASLISVIVDALTVRIHHAESITHKLRSEMETVARQSEGLEGAQANLRTSHTQLFDQVQDILANDKKFILELEQLKTRFSTIQQGKPAAEPLPKRENLGANITNGDILAAATPTEQRGFGNTENRGAKSSSGTGKAVEQV